MNSPVRKKHSGHISGIDAMIANPGVDVIFDRGRRDSAQSGLPGASESGSVAND